MFTEKMLGTGQVARRYGLLHYHVTEVIRKGFVPQPDRVGRMFAIPESQLPLYEEAFTKSGYDWKKPSA